MIPDTNMELRSEILEYSLFLEKSINDLLLLHLGILDYGKMTRLFGRKPGITFKNKIDLLYDIDILDKSENSDLELLMIIRNKFLHDIECNSFLKVLSILDNGLKNKFKSFLNENANLSDESSCRTACSNLFLKNIKTIKNKVKERKVASEGKYEILQLQNESIIFHLDLFFDLTKELSLILENAELEDEKVRALSELIFNKYNQYLNKYNSDENFNINKKRLHSLLADVNVMKNFSGITKIDEEKLPDFQSYIDELKK